MITDGNMTTQISELVVLAAGLLSLVAGLQLVYLALKRKASLKHASGTKRRI